MKKSEVLVVPMMVQAYAYHLTDTHAAEYVTKPDADVSDQVLQETNTIAELRKRRNNAKRTIYFNGDSLHDDELDDVRKATWDASLRILEQTENEGSLYLQLSQNRFDPADRTKVFALDHPTAPAYIRSEEGLLEHCEILVDNIKTRLTTADGKLGNLSLSRESENRLEYKDQNGTSRFIDLRGYTFGRRTDRTANDRIHFANYPSCAVFRAAAVLEQTELSDTIIHIFDRGGKKLEYAARSVLRASGIQEAPVESVALSDDGNINLLFTWHKNRKQQGSVRNIIRHALSVKDDINVKH